MESLIKAGAMGDFGKRSALLASIDQVKDKMQKPKGDDNQFGLFGEDIKKTSVLSNSILIEDTDEFDHDEIVSMERDLLGFSLSAKPISEVIAPFESKTTHKINEISIEETYKDPVKVAGVITEVRVITTKKSGAEMCFAKMEDGTAMIELVVFPKIFQDTKEHWVAGTPLLVIGKVDHRDESSNILVDGVETLSQAPVLIKIPDGTPTEKLQELKDLLMKRYGEREGFIQFANGKLVKLSFKIGWGKELEDEVSKLLS
jgi:DNA polymerase-3 subunit alpha